MRFMRYLLLSLLMLFAIGAKAQVTVRVDAKRIDAPGVYKVHLTFIDAQGNVLSQGDYNFDANIAETVRQQVALLSGPVKTQFDNLVPGVTTVTIGNPPTPPVVTAGTYHAGTGLIAGSASAQNLASIENPAANTANIHVTVTISGSLNALSTTQFLYHVGRTTGLPTAGTVITSQDDLSAYPMPAPIVRQAPTATAAAGDWWVGVGSPLVTAAGQDVVLPLTTEEIILAPGEGLVVRADANSTSWRHAVVFKWASE